MQRVGRAESHDPPPSPREFVSGEGVLYLRRHYRLKVQPEGSGPARLRGGWLHVPAPAGPPQAAHARASLITWFRRHAAERLPERVEAWRATAGISPSRVVGAHQQKRRGGCDPRGAIRLNWRIVQAPMRCSHARAYLAGRGPRHARLRAAAGGPAALRRRVHLSKGKVERAGVRPAAGRVQARRGGRLCLKRHAVPGATSVPGSPTARRNDEAQADDR